MLPIFLRSDPNFLLPPFFFIFCENQVLFTILISKTMALVNARQSLISTARQMEALHLNHGATGNLSLRDGEGFWITPSGVPTAEMTTEDMVWMRFDGAVRGRREPSSEWLMHRDILTAYPEHQAVLHAHAPNCTALACLERELPAFHYMIAVTGGDSVRCAPYHTFGSLALAQAAVSALQDRRACLLAHHGLITAADSLSSALSIAVEVESLCEIYFKALTVGEPPRLSAEQMAEALEKFKHYGEKNVPHLLP